MHTFERITVAKNKMVVKYIWMSSTGSGRNYFQSYLLWAVANGSQGSPNWWEPVQFDRLPVKSVRPGSDLDRYQTGLNLNSKQNEKFSKIPKNTS